MERVGGKERKYQVDGRSFCSTIVEFCVFVWFSSLGRSVFMGALCTTSHNSKSSSSSCTFPRGDLSWSLTPLLIKVFYSCGEE